MKWALVNALPYAVLMGAGFGWVMVYGPFSDESIDAGWRTAVGVGVFFAATQLPFYVFIACVVAYIVLVLALAGGLVESTGFDIRLPRERRGRRSGLGGVADIPDAVHRSDRGRRSSGRLFDWRQRSPRGASGLGVAQSIHATTAAGNCRTRPQTRWPGDSLVRCEQSSEASTSTRTRGSCLRTPPSSLFSHDCTSVPATDWVRSPST